MSRAKLFAHGAKDRGDIIEAFGVLSRYDGIASESGGSWWAWRRSDGVVYAHETAGLGFIDGGKDWAAEPFTRANAIALGRMISDNSTMLQPSWRFKTEADLFAWLMVNRPHWCEAHGLIIPNPPVDPWLTQLANYRLPNA